LPAFLAPFMLAGAAFASASLVIARQSERKALAAGDDLADVRLTDTEKRELLGVDARTG
jgi:hypothetical protein